MTSVTWPAADEGLGAITDRNRLAALRRLLLLDTPPTPGFDRITRMTAQLVGAPMALLNLVDADQQWIKSDHGLPEALRDARQVPLSHSFCAFVVAAGGPLAVADTHAEATLVDHPLVRDLGVRAYAGAPVLSPEGYAVGALCAADDRPRPWSVEQLALLDDLAAIATREIALHVHERREGHRRLWDGIAWHASSS